MSLGQAACLVSVYVYVARDEQVSPSHPPARPHLCLGQGVPGHVVYPDTEEVHGVGYAGHRFAEFPSALDLKLTRIVKDGRLEEDREWAVASCRQTSTQRLTPPACLGIHLTSGDGGRGRSRGSTTDLTVILRLVTTLGSTHAGATASATASARCLTAQHRMTPLSSTILSTSDKHPTHEPRRPEFTIPS